MSIYEEWRDIRGYEGYYQVSNFGNVRNSNNLVLKKRCTNWGYYCVVLYRDGKPKTYPIHRLVAFAFVDGYFPGAFVNHKDENKTNNIPDNLEWCTQKYNSTYGTSLYRSGLKRRNDHKRSKTVKQYSLTGELLKTYPSTCEVERSLGFDQGNISKAITKGSGFAYGFRWEYA